ncbi:MAG: AAA family ATPase [Pirellulaceae bacterium]|nr:AAA family ATPase [Pirellulaceae bacterium]
MSTKEDTSLDHSSNGQSLVVHQAAPLGVKDVDWGTVPGYATGGGAAPTDPATYLHAIRRHWLLAIVLGVMLAGLATAATWVLIPKKYTATAIIEVARDKDVIVFAEKAYNTPQEYEVFQNTQLQYVTTPAVLTAALRDQEVNSLPIVQREKADQIKWLKDELSVSFPRGAQIMEVSLSDVDPEQVTKVVEAVVDAYMTEIVERDRRLNDQKLADLQRVLNSRDAEIRNQQRLYERRVEELGTADKDTLILQNNLRMQQLGMFRNQLTRVQFDLRQYRSEFKAAEAALNRLNESPAIAVELETMRQKDPMCRDLEKQIAQLQQMLASQGNMARAGAETTLGSQLNDQMAMLQNQYNAHLAGLQMLIVEGKRVTLQETMADRALLAELAAAEEKSLEEEIAKLQEEFQTIGRSTVELDMLQMTLDDLKAVRTTVANKHEALKVEMGSLPRIRRGPPVQEPKTANNTELKYALSILAGLVGLVLPGFIVVRWDVHKQRVNSSDDVAKKLGLPVIGSVPVIPARAIKRLNAPSKASHQWNVRLAESIDGIAAKLLRNAALAKDRVVLITSAVSGEGKTTLATQVAMSLARAGKSTVLVDFDLRRPAIDKAFQLPLHPGVSEALCGEADVKTLAQPTGLAKLEVITAGRCDRHVLQALANGGDKRLFDELREAYDFVIVDGSPILPVADSRYLSQHVDSVLLSVFRDYSRMPKVTAAREILEAFGVRDVEAVVTSASEGGYGVVDMVAQTPQASA